MSDLVNLLSLYNKSPRKFDRAVKKATKKLVSASDVINMAIRYIKGHDEDLHSGALRPVRTVEDIFSVVKLGKHLIGKEVFRIWSGGKNGKICSKVVVKGLVVKEDGVYVETQAGYSAEFLEPVVRKLNLSDLNITWFLTEEACKKAIDRM